MIDVNDINPLVPTTVYQNICKPTDAFLGLCDAPSVTKNVSLSAAFSARTPVQQIFIFVFDIQRMFNWISIDDTFSGGKCFSNENGSTKRNGHWQSALISNSIKKITTDSFSIGAPQ